MEVYSGRSRSTNGLFLWIGSGALAFAVALLIPDFLATGISVPIRGDVGYIASVLFCLNGLALVLNVVSLATSGSGDSKHFVSLMGLSTCLIALGCGMAPFPVWVVLAIASFALLVSVCVWLESASTGTGLYHDMVMALIVIMAIAAAFVSGFGLHEEGSVKVVAESVGTGALLCTMVHWFTNTRCSLINSLLCVLFGTTFGFIGLAAGMDWTMSFGIDWMPFATFSPLAWIWVPFSMMWALSAMSSGEGRKSPSNDNTLNMPGV